MTAAACTYGIGGGLECGSTDDVHPYPKGLRCSAHGHPQPDPSASIPARRPADPPRQYGTATTDPLGRTIPGTARTGFIPKRPDPKGETS